MNGRWWIDRNRSPDHTVAAATIALGGPRQQVLDPSALLARHADCIGQLRQQAGVPVAHWTALYECLLHNFARFVQQLPASEAHHHWRPGGLLQHGLDTALRALTIRRGVLLPSSAIAEQLAETQDLWTYATATAALLHDLGKPVVDQVVTLFDADGRDTGRWNPLAGPMPKATALYSVDFVRGRRYRLHARLPPLLVQFIVPPIGLEWLTRDLDVFEAWLATISGADPEFAGELGQIIKQADGLSVAADLSGHDADPGDVRPGPRSLGERLAVALRHLIDAQALPLNRPGAGGWVIDGDLWLVSKRVLDALREQMAQDSAGGSLPRNERLMDELQQSGIVMSNGDRAIWTATVELRDWRQQLTLLRVPLTRLWPDAATRPGSVSGRVVPVTSDVPRPNDRGTAATIGSADARAAPADADEGEPALRPPSDAKKDSDLLSWIRDGVSAGRLKINTVDARLHVTREGLLLVSPGIFRDFAGVDGWAAAQKRFQKLKLHLKTPESTNIWTYRVSGERKSSAQLKGLLIPDGDAVLGLTLPEPNPHLSLLTPEPKPVESAGETALADP